MDSLSISSVSEQAVENNVNSKLLLPRKPAYTKADIDDEDKELPTQIDEERDSVLYDEKGKQKPERSIQKASMNSSHLLIEKGKKKSSHIDRPDNVLSYNKADFDDEDKEWPTQINEEHHSVPYDEKGKQKPERSIQKASMNSSHLLIEKGEKKSSHIDRENKECGVSRSSSHVIHVKQITETSDCDQGLTEKLCRSASTCEAFIQFCSREIICPQEYRAALATKLYGLQAALLSALGNPFENLSQSMSSRNNSHILVLSLGQASTGFLPAIIWTGMFIVSSVYTVTVVWSLDFRVPIISMLCLALLYCLSLLVAAASGFNVLCGTFRISGVLFACAGVFSFVVLLFVLVMLVLFVSWQHTNKDGGAK